MRFAAGFITCLIVLALAGVAYIYSGLYNVAATDQHGPVAEWIFGTTMEHSIAAHARGIMVPAGFDTPARREEGFPHFRETCQPCHGAPGVERAAIGKGLTPEPPSLSEAVKEWSDAELFWILKHGIKMTGMAAWGPTHDDAALWSIVAFIRHLPELTPEAYRRLDAGEAGESGAAHPSDATGPAGHSAGH